MATVRKTESTSLLELIREKRTAITEIKELLHSGSYGKNKKQKRRLYLVVDLESMEVWYKIETQGFRHRYFNDEKTAVENYLWEEDYSA